MNAWNEYVEAIVAARRAAVRFLTRVTQILKLYFKRKKPAALFQELFSEELWEETDDLWARQPMLPKAAVDEWGDVAEPSKRLRGTARVRLLPPSLFNVCNPSSVRNASTVKRWATSFGNQRWRSTLFRSSFEEQSSRRRRFGSFFVHID